MSSRAGGAGAGAGGGGGSGGGEDLASTDEVKVYNDEGADELEQRSSEKFLSEDKLGLVTETEEGKPSLPGHSFQVNGKSRGALEDKNSGSSYDGGEAPMNHFGFFYHNPYGNGAAGLAAVKMASSLHGHAAAAAGLLPYSDFIPQPPPAHTGLKLFPVHIVDPKTGLSRSPMFPLPGGAGGYPLYSDLTSAMQPWQNLGYQAVGSAGFRNPYMRYPGSLLPSPHHQFPTGVSGLSQPALVTPGPKQEILTGLDGRFMHHAGSDQQGGSKPQDSGGSGGGVEQLNDKKRVHIKKPLNAFMLFMKEMRAKVVSECTLKESAAINQILGRKWHALDRSEQAKYYEMAKKERELHMKLYPGWSARDNYAMHSKKKKRRRESQSENKECSNPKKCRARFGLDQQSQWCKPCRRKKKCIRFMTGDPNADTRDSDDNSDDEEGNVADTTNDDDDGASRDSYCGGDGESSRSSYDDMDSLGGDGGDGGGGSACSRDSGPSSTAGVSGLERTFAVNGCSAAESPLTGDDCVSSSTATATAVAAVAAQCRLPCMGGATTRPLSILQTTREDT